jgi:phenylacetate-coenzyme A ligase PaaK-like adenylate-forming protein
VSIERLRRLAPAFAGTLRSFSFLQPVHELLAQLDAWAPTVLASYPSTALALAGEQSAGRLHIAPLEIWTGGETLTPPARVEIERAFACRVANSYGASEFFTLGSECRAGALHLNADWAILEPVDREGRPVPEGQPSDTVLLTNLANQLQPIIRYDLGDRVTLQPGTCACGSPLPRLQVDGRCGDLLALRDAQRRLVRLAPLAIETVLEEEAGAFDFHLEQTSPSALALRMPGAGTDSLCALDRAGTALAAFLAAQGLGNVQVDARLGPRRAPQASGKLRRIVGLGAAAGGRGSSPRRRSAVGEPR